MAVIEVEGLRKEYRRLRGGRTVAVGGRGLVGGGEGRRNESRRRGGGRTVAVDGLDLSVEAGGVFGFLGPNGAGKTTTIRCLLGLVPPTARQARPCGHDGDRDSGSA